MTPEFAVADKVTVKGRPHIRTITRVEAVAVQTRYWSVTDWSFVPLSHWGSELAPVVPVVPLKPVLTVKEVGG